MNRELYYIATGEVPVVTCRNRIGSCYTRIYLDKMVLKSMVMNGRVFEIFGFDEPVDEIVIWEGGIKCTVIDVRRKVSFYDRLMTLSARYRTGVEVFNAAMDNWFFWRHLLSPLNSRGLSVSTVSAIIDSITRHYCRLP